MALLVFVTVTGKTLYPWIDLPRKRVDEIENESIKFSIRESQSVWHVIQYPKLRSGSNSGLKILTLSHRFSLSPK